MLESSYNKSINIFSFFMDKHIRGFTLIELLVVIAIIGILSSVVLTNLNGTRQKARDVKRIADVMQLQLALQLYFDSHSGKYPGRLSDLLPDYISPLPTPPSGAGQTNYTYVPLNTTCNSYHLGAVLEQDTNTNLTSDVDASAAASVGSNCFTAVIATADFYGLATTCDSTTSTPPDKCYDVTP